MLIEILVFGEFLRIFSKIFAAFVGGMGDRWTMLLAASTLVGIHEAVILKPALMSVFRYCASPRILYLMLNLVEGMLKVLTCLESKRLRTSVNL